MHALTHIHADTDAYMLAGMQLSKMKREKITSGARKEAKNRPVRLVDLD